MENLSEHMVTVCCMTYNHESFIRDCLEGFVKQVTSFPFIVIVHDDASTDNNQEIIREYAKKYSHIIKPIFQKENQWKGLGINPLLHHALPNVTTKYIALCEGDDYWTDPYKLQKQVDFLEANPHISLCFHPVEVLFPDGHTEEDYLVKGLMDKQESTLYDMAAVGNYIHTPSVVFRNVLAEIPNQIYEAPIVDFFIYMLLGRHGNYFRLEEPMAVYRYGVGIHSTQAGKERNSRWIKTLELIEEVIPDKTVHAIFDYRIQVHRLQSLPKNLRDKENFHDINKADTLATYVSWKELMKALFKKFQ